MVFFFLFFSRGNWCKSFIESVADGKYYFPLIKFLSDLNFNLSFDPSIENLKIVPIPISSLFFHSIFFRLSNFYSFIFLEFISLTTFIFLLYKINRFIFPKKISLIYSLLILCLPSVINLSFLNEIQYLKVFSDNIYNFRVPRPMVSNLFLLSFVYLILKTFIKNSYTVKNFLLIGLVLGLSLSSFYYYFVLESLVLISIIILKYKFNFVKIFFLGLNIIYI